MKLKRHLNRHNQRLEILYWLRKHQTLSTIESRQLLGILHPAGRIKELRQEGHNIDTCWHDEYDSLGQSHRVARYTLLSGKYQREGRDA